MSIESIMSALAPTIGPPRTVELGKIKIGGLGEVRKTAAGREWRMPRKDNFFTVTSIARDARGDLIPDTALMEALIHDYGDKDGKLRQLPIRLLSDNLENVMQARFCWYGNKLAGAVSDGKTVTWRFDPDTLQPYIPPREEPWKDEMLGWTDKKGNKLFKMHANFSCTIYSENGRWGGAYVFRTTSVISFRQLYASLLEIADKTGGVLLGIPLWLCIRPMQVSPEGKPSTVFVVHLEIRGQDIQDLQRMALEQAAFRAKFTTSLARFEQSYQKLLSPPGDETPEDAADIAAEFVPDEPPEGIFPPDNAAEVAPDGHKLTMAERMAAELKTRQTAPAATTKPADEPEAAEQPADPTTAQPASTNQPTNNLTTTPSTTTTVPPTEPIATAKTAELAKQLQDQFPASQHGTGAAGLAQANTQQPPAVVAPNPRGTPAERLRYTLDKIADATDQPEPQQGLNLLAKIEAGLDKIGLDEAGKTEATVAFATAKGKLLTECADAGTAPQAAAPTQDPNLAGLEFLLSECTTHTRLDELATRWEYDKPNVAPEVYQSGIQSISRKREALTHP